MSSCDPEGLYFCYAFEVQELVLSDKFYVTRLIFQDWWETWVAM